MHPVVFCALLITLLLAVCVCFTGIILHELGHAIPALIFTGKPVKIFIGSYNNVNESLRLRLGKLQFFLIKKPLKWQFSISHYAGGMSSRQQIIVTSGGVLVTLLLVPVAAWMAFKPFTTAPGLIAHCVGMMFLFSLVLNIWTGMIPRAKPFYPGMMYNDGARIRMLLGGQDVNSRYMRAFGQLHDEKFADAATNFRSLMEVPATSVVFLRHALLSFCNTGAKEEAITTFQRIGERAAYDAADYNTMGLLYLRGDDIDKALFYFDRSLQADARHTFALVNRSAVYLFRQQYQEALADLNRALDLNPQLAYAWCNRGWLKIKQGNTDEGREELFYGLQLAPENGEVLCMVGRYYLETGNAEKALPYLLQAKARNPLIKDVDRLLQTAQGMLGRS